MITKSKLIALSPVAQPSRLRVRPASRRQSLAPRRCANPQAGTPALRFLTGILCLLMSTCAALPLLAQTTTQDFPNAVQFELGDSGFLPGDSITIQELRGTSDVIQPGDTYCVTGTYTLASHDEATLCFYVTTTNATSTPEEPAQRVHLTKGTGSFLLIKKMNEVGYLHLTFYSHTGGFGGVYFGQGQWVLHDAHYDFTGASSQPATNNADPVSTTGPNQVLFDYLGNPVTPPSDMNAAYTKDGLTQAMQAAAQAAGISLANLQIDDSEFPFLIGVTFAKEGDKDKLKAQLGANAVYTSSAGGVGGEISYVMNIVPSSAFPQGTFQQIYRRLMLREAVLYDKITANP